MGHSSLWRSGRREDTRQGQRCHKKRKLQANNTDEHRCKNPYHHLFISAWMLEQPLVLSPQPASTLSEPSGACLMLPASVPSRSCLPGTWAHVLLSDTPLHAASPCLDVISSLMAEDAPCSGQHLTACGSQVCTGSTPPHPSTSPTRFFSISAMSGRAGQCAGAFCLTSPKDVRDSMDVSVSKLRETRKDREAWRNGGAEVSKAPVRYHTLWQPAPPGTVRPICPCGRLACLASCELRFPAWAKSGSWRSFLRGSIHRAGVDLGDPSHRGRKNHMVQRGLAPRSKGNARAELRPARRQARLPHSRSLPLTARER